MTIDPRSLTNEEFIQQAEMLYELPRAWQSNALDRLAAYVHPKPPAEGSVQALQQLKLFP